MTPLGKLAAISALALGLNGCAAKSVFDIATTPVHTARGGAKTAANTYDVLTTSQSEKDQKRGRKIRKREARLAKLEREYRSQNDDCARGDRSACADRNETWQEMEALRPLIPARSD